MMIVITQQSGGTNIAQIRTAKDRGFRIIYRGSCTESEAAAARSVVRKYYGAKAADSVERVPDNLIGEHMPDNGPRRKRCVPVCVWTFKH
jgi:hypothetical protein